MRTREEQITELAHRLACQNDRLEDGHIQDATGVNARPKRRGPRWVGVMERTGMGSTASVLLCRRFGFDPDEVVK